MKSFIFGSLPDKSFFEINSSHCHNIYLFTYPNFTKITRTLIFGIFSLHSVTVSDRCTINISIVLSLNSFVNLEALLAAELPHILPPVARTISSNEIVMTSLLWYVSILSVFAIYLFLCPKLRIIFILLHGNDLLQPLSVTFTGLINCIRLFRKVIYMPASRVHWNDHNS